MVRCFWFLWEFVEFLYFLECPKKTIPTAKSGITFFCELNLSPPLPQPLPLPISLPTPSCIVADGSEEEADCWTQLTVCCVDLHFSQTVSLANYNMHGEHPLPSNLLRCQWIAKQEVQNRTGLLVRSTCTPQTDDRLIGMGNHFCHNNIQSSAVTSNWCVCELIHRYRSSSYMERQ